MPKPRSAHYRRVLLAKNFVGLALIGTAVCIWTQYYSNCLPEIATLLGGGGVLVWLSSALHLIESDQVDEFKKWTATNVLSSSILTNILIIGSLTLILVAAQLGAVQVNALSGEPEHSIQIRKANTTSDEWSPLVPSQPLRKVFWTFWWNPSKVSVFVKGYPEKVVQVKPLQRISVLVPTSVRTRVVLLRPQLAITDAAKSVTGSPSPTMFIDMDTKDSQGQVIHRRAPFDGHSILVGGNSDISVPGELVDTWHSELKNQRSDVILLWKYPNVPDDFAIALNDHQEVTVSISSLNKANNQSTVLLKQSFIVSPIQNSVPFLQEVVLYAKAN